MSKDEVRDIVSIIEEMGGRVKEVNYENDSFSMYTVGSAIEQSINTGSTINVLVSFGPYSAQASKEVLDDIITVRREQNLRRHYPELQEAYEAYKILAKLYS